MKPKHLIKTRLAAAALLAAAAMCPLASLRAQVLVTFDTSADYPSSFATNGGNASWSSTGGVNNTGMVAIGAANTNPTFVYNQSTFNFGSGTWLIRQDAYVGAANSVINTFGMIHLGMGNGTGTNFGGNQNQLGVRVQGTGTAGTLSWALRGANGTANTNFNTSFPTFTLSTGNWYRFEAGFTRNATGTASNGVWDITMQVWNLGPNGTSSPASVSSFSYTANASTFGGNALGQALTFFWNNPTVYAAVNTRNATDQHYQFFRMDNFEVVPEPSAVALILVATAGLILRRRRAV